MRVIKGADGRWYKVRENPSYDFNRIVSTPPTVRLNEYREMRRKGRGLLVINNSGQIVEIGPDVLGALLIHMGTQEPAIIRTRLFKKLWNKVRQ
jgi:hypothetical protein